MEEFQRSGDPTVDKSNQSGNDERRRELTEQRNKAHIAVEDPVKGMLAPHPSGACSDPVENSIGSEFRVRHVNSNDGTVEGLDLLGKPAFTVQFHPEACPGPHDASYLFDRFKEMVSNSLTVSNPETTQGRVN